MRISKFLNIPSVPTGKEKMLNEVKQRSELLLSKLNG